ncbi:MAG: aldo/keto reductase [Planctomycetota bacterium]|jgi:aryl-alcohol dehydrogenase-like predicted oxidoreductase
MRTRVFGRGGIEVSEIGLGGHREGVEAHPGVARTARFFRSARERARVVGRAIDGGVTYFDTTYGCEIASLGESLRILGRRDGLFVSGMRVDFFSNFQAEAGDARAYTRREVEARIREFGFDHLDQFMLGALDIGDTLAGDASVVDDTLDELGRLREEGKIRFVGFSCHGPDYAGRLLETWPAFDSVMTPYNFVNRQAEGALAEALRKTGAAWIAMKPLVWHVYGLPVTVLRNLRSVPPRPELDADAPIAALALRFILANPLVTSVVPAVNSVQAVEENLSATGASDLSEAELNQLEAYAAVMAADDMIPLAIGGLLEDDLRVRSHAIGLAADRLGLDVDPIDYHADDAEDRAGRIAGDILARLREDPKWASFMPEGARSLPGR